MDLERARREAKALLKAARAGDPAALARVGAGPAPKLAAAQRAVARELGERSWPRLVRRAELGAALVEAARARDVAALRALLRLGAPPDARGRLGGTALHHAAWLGDATAVRVLLAHGADPHDVSPETRSTPLGWAVHGSRQAPPGGDQVAAAESLFAAGARPEPDLAREAAGELATWLAAHVD